MMTTAIVIVVCYLVGSIPFGVIVGRMRGFDPRAVGSGNIGMTNVARAGGASAAAMTFVGDILKGAIPVAVVRLMGFPPAILAWAGLAAFVGAICSVFLKFSGGKGLSASLGIWIVLSPLALLFPLAAWGITLATTRIMSLASIVAAVVLIPAAFALSLPQPYVALAVAMSVLAVARHHENIGRLLAGTEPRFRMGKRQDAA